MTTLRFKCSLPLLIEVEASDCIKKASLLPSASGFCCQIKGNPTPEIVDSIHNFLEGYTQQESRELPPLDWSQLTPFTQTVLHLLTEVPFGSSSTYGEIAARASNPQGARAVGGACGRNPFILFVPCHRILGSAKGACRFGGFTGGLPIKKILLDFERIDY